MAIMYFSRIIFTFTSGFCDAIKPYIYPLDFVFCIGLNTI
jgi:hypothetical protein